MALVVVAGFEKSDRDPEAMDINYRRLTDYNLGQALALLLRPIGFLAATFLFLFLEAALLGERRLVLAAIVAALAAGLTWYLVDAVLSIYRASMPNFITT